MVEGVLKGDRPAIHFKIISNRSGLFKFRTFLRGLGNIRSGTMRFLVEQRIVGKVGSVQKPSCNT